ncbi:MAG TPA: NADH-quinone oxidoreductase subunit C [Burkholderiaceae bacterium]|nr:NADH-quinone oxidoreductase subunit C [Burkholderiaceae bacterium]
MSRAEALASALREALGDKVREVLVALGEVTIVIDGADHLSVARVLRDDARFDFAQLIDLAGIDYSSFGETGSQGPRFAVVMHLLSLRHNWRVRVRSLCADEELPLISSVTELWTCANWYEREAFDLYGIVFEGHPDLRRILTDYGFIGHPFRKDFPIYGHVEMRYDPEQKRVIYQPVTIEPREIVPRVIREDTYGQGR